MTDRHPPGHLLCIGAGYTAGFTARAMLAEGWQVSGTTRSPEKAEALESAGILPIIWAQSETNLPGKMGSEITSVQFPENALNALSLVTEILVSAPPREEFCPALNLVEPFREMMPNLRSVIYYSSTGACGDHDGAWIDENTPSNTRLARGKARLAVEKSWQTFGTKRGLPVTILRLSGIYGPGRNALETLIRQGEAARRIVREGQVFNRIHVEDIAAITRTFLLREAAGTPPAHRLYNLADDEPAPPQEVIEYAAHLLERPLPPLIPFEEAELSPMGRSFYAENKRIRNTRVKTDLAIDLLYPTYREGLQALLPFVSTRKDSLK